MAAFSLNHFLLLPRLIFLLLQLLSHANSISFNFPNFHPNINISRIHFEGDAFQSAGVLQLTKNQADDQNITSSTGRATYNQPVPIWDAETGRLTDFTTHFSFIIKALDRDNYGAGLSFFLAPYDSKIPPNSSEGFLALFSPETAITNISSNQVVAVEFDSYMNEWDPSDDHVGINVNSIVSVTNVTWRSSIKNGSIANAWVSYNSTTKNLSLLTAYSNNPIFSGNYSVSYTVDLREVLPEQVRVGFSASTDGWVEIHNILSWSFDSTHENH